MKTINTLLFISLFSFSSFSQIGGKNSFALLGMDFNARSVGLAGDYMTTKDHDISLGVNNPSLLNNKMSKAASVSQAIHAGRINTGMFNYGFSLSEKQTLSAHVRYVAYGKMDRTDKTGASQGEFSAFEYILGVGYGHQLNERISVGANFNVIGSHLEVYNSYGASIDLAGSYQNKAENLLVTAMVKNFGLQFNKYAEERAPLPANFLIALGYKLPHAPFRFSIVAHHLNKWDITYTDPNAKETMDLLTGEIIPPKRPGFGEKLAQHFTYQVEILAGKTLHFRTGFDYYRRQNMKVVDKPGMAGFSFGLGLYFKKFSIDYGFSVFSKAGFNNMITFSTNFNKAKI